jgi:hypothetical protein
MEAADRHRDQQSLAMGDPAADSVPGRAESRARRGGPGSVHASMWTKTQAPTTNATMVRALSPPCGARSSTPYPSEPRRVQPLQMFPGELAAGGIIARVVEHHDVPAVVHLLLHHALDSVGRCARMVVVDPHHPHAVPYLQVVVVHTGSVRLWPFSAAHCFTSSRYHFLPCVDSLAVEGKPACLESRSARWREICSPAATCPILNSCASAICPRLRHSHFTDRPVAFAHFSMALVSHTRPPASSTSGAGKDRQGIRRRLRPPQLGAHHQVSTAGPAASPLRRHRGCWWPVQPLFYAHWGLGREQPPSTVERCLVFVNTRGNTPHLSSFASQTWKKARAAIGRPDLRWHDLRHTYVAIRIAAGAHPKEIQEECGHSSY